MESILHPYDLRTTKDQVHYHDVVDLLLLLINACMRELIVRISLQLSWLALFWMLLAFLVQSFWLLQLSISNVPRITTYILAFQVPHLVYPHIGRQAPTLGRSDLSPKNHSSYSLKMNLLIDPSDRLDLMSNLEFFFKFFFFLLV
jgi:hypothetical protein